MRKASFVIPNNELTLQSSTTTTYTSPGMWLDNDVQIRQKHEPFDLNSEQREISAMARDFAAKEMAPFALEWDAQKHFPVDVIRRTADSRYGRAFMCAKMLVEVALSQTRRHPHLRRSLYGLPLDGGIYLDPQHGRLDVRYVWK